jgi:glucosamine--fructose-6-phosphate aminotransferase (isomerizing)
MCGIFGYIGKKRNATQAVFEGLKRLDYRGYDSWGLAVVQDSNIILTKHVGLINKNLLKLPKAELAIGHTRWATNGAVTRVNAHPHYASDKSFVLAHNGICENFAKLKVLLKKKGYRFISQTDTEVIVHLIEQQQKRVKNLLEAVRLAFKQLKGRNTIIILAKNGQIIAARNGSPLVVGVTDNFSEIYFSSDTLSFAPYVTKILVLDNGQMVTARINNLKVFNIQNGKQVKYQFEKNELTDSAVGKNKYPHFMLKEIYEEPLVIRRLLEQPDDGYQKLAFTIKKAGQVYCLGSGTAGAAASQIAYYLRVFASIPAVGLIGAEACDYYNLIGKNDLLIAPSQSGETADVLEVLELARKKGAKIASFVNMPGSMITRLSDFKFMAQAGPEICVMSTKIFVSQLAWGYMLTKTVEGKAAQAKTDLKSLADKIEQFLDNKKAISQIKNLAQTLAKKPHIFLLGKGQNLQIIKEGMVKIVEGAYVHAHAIAAGDLKHYAITLMEPGVPVIFVVSNDSVKTDVLNAVYQTKARGAQIIGIASQPCSGFDQFIKVPDLGPTSAIINIVPLQLLAYYMAVSLGHNVDKPRNIAKSVTVK